MPLTVTGSLGSPQAFGQAIAQYGRRSVARKLRVQGEQAVALGKAYAGELGPSRSGNRRRDKGVSYRNGFEVTYTGLDDFAAGVMEVTVRNRSRHARVLEVGAKRHEIYPRNKKALFWPGLPNPIAAVKEPHAHPGFAGHHILERAARDSMEQGFVGQSVGHAQIVVRVGR